MNEYEEQQKNIRRTHDATNVRTINQADVIGLTTTALAGRIDMLRSLKPKIVICEEAGEVKESDIISALMPGLQQVIQIGDHKQLRPNINNYDLSLESTSGQKWQLDRSQFERRGEGEPGLDPSPLTQLNVQRRMRPEVSQLIRGVYPKLIDHESVLDAPDVVGMLDNVFWLDHSHPQDVGGDGTRVKSHSNRWETSMATALIRHLVRQGKYKAEDIALLTPYMGQLQQLRTALSRDFEICLGDLDREQLAHENFEDESSSKKPVEKKKLLQTIRLATVDNFQGEEAKIIVVSLVRSNPQRQVGFLRTENRINVLLSRAKHGMYLIGNVATYLNVPMWADVHDILEKSNSVGTELRLCCPRHPETPIACSEPEDFSIRSPEGGCTLSCSRRLEPCGHKCQATCHSEAMHDAFTCTRSCPRIRMTCTHQCPKLCGESCGPCLTKVYCIDLPCGHTSISMACYQTQNLEAFKCTTPVERTLPHCGHSATLECHQVGNTVLPQCKQTCTHILPCGHGCSGTCSGCQGGVHPGCVKLCDRPYSTCNHRCNQKCHNGEACGSCKQPCEVSLNIWKRQKLVSLTKLNTRFNALTLRATQSATNHALHASSLVHGRVPIRALVLCHALLLATDSLATNDATRSCHVVTNARAFAERFVLSVTAKCATGQRRLLELTSWSFASIQKLTWTKLPLSFSDAVISSQVRLWTVSLALAKSTIRTGLGTLLAQKTCLAHLRKRRLAVLTARDPFDNSRLAVTTESSTEQ